MAKNEFSEITPYISDLAQRCRTDGLIDAELYKKYEVNRGLRDIRGRGVLTGLTEVSEVEAYEEHDGELVPCEGRLFYRGVNIKELVKGAAVNGHNGFEECVYLLLFGKLPTVAQLEEFCGVLGGYRSLPTSFVRDIIMKAPSRDMMNVLARSVLTMYSYDDNADDISVENTLRQCLQLISLFPLFAVYGYQAYAHYHDNQSLFIHPSRPELSTAENLLSILRKDSSYTSLEAATLDMALILHAEHGGGNNSTFTNHVVTSSGTDTYSAMAASIGSLKGPRHGGANIKVVHMFDDMKENIGNCPDDARIKAYLSDVLDKKAFDGAGLIYGMGHAVYSVSDPRADVLKEYARRLSEEKGLSEEYDTYCRTAKIASELIAERRRIYKGVSPNVDFYSGFVYRMLGLPEELFTPIFAVARVAGWSAHRIEEIINTGKIIRPAYRAVKERVEYVRIEDRV